MTEEKPLSRQELILRIVELVEASAKFPEERYYTQYDSPLGRTRHSLLARRGALQGYKVGRTIYILREDVHKFIEEHKIEPTNPEIPKPKRATERTQAPVPNPLDAVKGL